MADSHTPEPAVRVRCTNCGAHRNSYALAVVAGDLPRFSGLCHVCGSWSAMVVDPSPGDVARGLAHAPLIEGLVATPAPQLDEQTADALRELDQKLERLLSR